MINEKYTKPLKTKKLIKRALKHPELFTHAELTYFKMMKKADKKPKAPKSDYLK